MKIPRPNRAGGIGAAISVAAFLFLPASLNAATGADVEPIPWEDFTSGKPADATSLLWETILADNVGYAIGWLEDQHGTPGAIMVGTNQESFIRPRTFYACSIAVAVATGAFSETAAGYTEAEAIAWSLGVVRAHAAAHKANDPSPAWGEQWQSSMWAHRAGLAAWLLWEHLDDPGDRDEVVAMITYEAETLLNGYNVPGKGVFPDYSNGVGGDTKAEENGWMTGVLVLAAQMLPDDPRAPVWRETAVEYMMATHANPFDLQDPTLLHGREIRDWVEGWNIEPSGWVSNHGAAFHPDYTNAPISGMAQVAVTRLLGGDTVPQAALHNLGNSYRALAEYSFDPANGFPSPGGTIFRDDGIAYWPLTIEKDRRFRFYNYASASTFATVVDFYAPPPGHETAAYWESYYAGLTRQDQLAQGDGSTGQNTKGDYNPSGAIATSYLLRWLDHNAGITISNESVVSPDAAWLRPKAPVSRVVDHQTGFLLHAESPTTDLTAISLVQTSGLPATITAAGSLMWWIGFSGNGTHAFQLDLTNSVGTTSITREVIVGPFSPGTIPPGQVVHYRFDESSGTAVSDAAGGDHGATLSGGATFSPGAGKSGGAVTFDGMDGLVTLPQSDDISTRSAGYPARTLSLHYRIDSLPSGREVIFEEGGENKGFAFYLDGGDLYFGAWSTDWPVVERFHNAGSSPTGRWVHLAIVLDSTAAKVRFYRDGILLAELGAAAMGSHANATTFGGVAQKTRFHDGSFGDTQPHFFSGKIDEFYLYNAALNDTGIAALAMAVPLTLDAVIPAAIPPLSSVMMTATTSGGADPVVLWENPSGPGTGRALAPDSATTSFLFDLPGSYTVAVRADDGNVALRRTSSVEVSGTAEPSAYTNFQLLHQVTSASGDPDGDGIPTGFEFLAGTDPNTPDASQTVEADFTPDTMILRLLRSDALDLFPVVKTSTTLEAWSDVTGITPVSETASPERKWWTFSIPRPPGEGSRFYRFEFEP